MGSTARPVRGTPEVTRPVAMPSHTKVPMPSPFYNNGNIRNMDPLRHSLQKHQQQSRRGSLTSASDHGNSKHSHQHRGSMLQPLPYGSDHGSSRHFRQQSSSLLQPIPYGSDHGSSKRQQPTPNLLLQPPVSAYRSPRSPIRSSQSVASARHHAPPPQRGTMTATQFQPGPHQLPSMNHSRSSYSSQTAKRDARGASVPRSQAYASVNLTTQDGLSPSRSHRRTVDAYVPWSTYAIKRQPRIEPVSELSTSTHSTHSQRSMSVSARGATRGAPRGSMSYQYSPPQRRLVVSRAIPTTIQTAPPSSRHDVLLSPQSLNGNRGHRPRVSHSLVCDSSSSLTESKYRGLPGSFPSEPPPMKTPPPPKSQRNSNHNRVHGSVSQIQLTPQSHPVEPEQVNSATMVTVDGSSSTPSAFRQSVVYFNTNGSAKHIQYNKDKLNSEGDIRPKPIEGSAGSRIYVYLGATSQAFVSIFNEDDGNKKWQSKIWFDVPDGLDQKLRTLDTVLYCSFAGNNWFILTQCEQTGKTTSFWNVESDVLHSALTTHAQSNVPVRLVFGENGQYVVLHGTSGYQLGPNVPTQLQIALDRAYSSGSIIHSVHGLNRNGRFLLKESTQQISGDDVGISFRAQGLPPNLDHILRTRKKTEYAEYIVPSASTSWIVLGDDSFERDDDVHYELVLELDGFYSRHRNRQEKRLQEISDFSEKEVTLTKQNDVSVLEKGIVQKGTEKVTGNIIEKELVKAPGKKENKSTSQTPVHKKIKKKSFEAMNCFKTLRDKEDRIIEMKRKSLVVGDKISVLGVSKKLGEIVIKAIDPNNGDVVVETCVQNLKVKKNGSDCINTTARVSEICRIIKCNEDDGIEENCEFFNEALTIDKYEAAVNQYHIHCMHGRCDCKEKFWGFTERFQLPSMWKVGDRVNVIGYADGIVIQNKPKYSTKQHLVHVQYDDGTAYHVRADQIRPVKRVLPPNSCSFTSLTSFDETGLRLRPLFEDKYISGPMEKLFDEYQCAEKIDLRRLQKLVAYVQADSDQRKECMKSLVACLNKDPNNLSVDRSYRVLEHCYDMEETIYMLYDFVKSLKMDEKGCVAYECLYSHKNVPCRGRLFAIGRSVRVLYGKYPRSVTVQALHAELRAPLAGAFAHEVDSENSDVRLLCSLAKQLGIEELFPSLQDYRDNREKWISTIHEEYPDVSAPEVKRLVNVAICGGTYQTWLKMVGQVDVVSKIERFAFRIQSEVKALCDQLLYHPRFQWISFEWKQLEEKSRKQEEIKAILLTRILHDCENQVIGLVHRSFHKHGWIVRTKLFDSLLVEPGPTLEEEASSLNQVMRLAEKSCLDEAWDVRLVEKPLYQCQDKPPLSFEKARAFIRAFQRSAMSSGDTETYQDDEDDADDDDDDDVSLHGDFTFATSSADCQQDEKPSIADDAALAPATVQSMHSTDNHTSTKGRVAV
jgi:hypothetical protein